MQIIAKSNKLKRQNFEDDSHFCFVVDSKSNMATNNGAILVLNKRNFPVWIPFTEH